MNHTRLNELLIQHPGTADSVIYINSKVQNVLPIKNSPLFSFFNMLKSKFRSSLPGVSFINSVANATTIL